jgi:hypothetical protein
LGWIGVRGFLKRSVLPCPHPHRPTSPVSPRTPFTITTEVLGVSEYEQWYAQTILSHIDYFQQQTDNDTLETSYDNVKQHLKKIRDEATN